MNRRSGWLVLGLLTAPAVAWAEPRSVDAKALKGQWTDESGTKLLFSGGSEPKLKKIVDADGEVFSPLWSGWNEDHYQYVYRVPSTGYIVIINVLSVENNVGETTWTNDHMASGTERMFHD
jgi:hypothetical protein